MARSESRSSQRTARAGLETSPEELQSAVEELMRVNAGLKREVDELWQTNSDLSNVLASTDVAAVFLDRNLRVLRYTPAAVELFRLGPSDLGRPLTDIPHGLKYPVLQEDVERLLETLRPLKREIPDSAGRWFQAQLLPYRNAEEHLTGTVLTLVEVLDPRMEETPSRTERPEEIEPAREFTCPLEAGVERIREIDASRENESALRAIFRHASIGLSEVSLDGRFIRGNAEICRIVGLSQKELLTKRVADLSSPEDAAKTLEAIQRASVSSEPVSLEKRYVRPDGTFVWANISITRLEGAQGHVRSVLVVTRDVTAQRQAEEALRLSEERYRTLVHAVTNSVWRATGAGDQMLEVSGTVLFPQSLEEGPTPAIDWIAKCVHPDDFKATVETWNKAVENKTMYDNVHRILSADGKMRYALCRAVPLLDEAGNVREWIGTAADITETKRAEEALRLSEERLQRALAIETVGVLFFRTDGTITQANEAFLRMSGYSREDLQAGRVRWDTQTPPEFMPQSMQAIDEFITKGRTVPYEKQYIRKDGTRWWGLFAATRVSPEEGVEFVLDVSAQKEVEEALAASQERLRLVVENAREYAIISLDLDRCVTTWNSGAESILGYSEAEILHECCDIIFVPEDQAKDIPARETQTALVEGRAIDERWHQRKDGSRFWASGVMTAMRDARGEAVGFVKILRDQTAELLTKEALERSREELLAALKETERAREEAEAAGRAKDHFLAVLSHELRTPLTPVLMAVRVLSRDKNLQPNVANALKMIERNVQLEAHFVDDLLDVTRISRGKMELVCTPMDLHEALGHAVEISRSDFEAKRQHLTVSLEAEEHVFQGDLKRLQQVAWNLLKNASKFTLEGGEIHLRSRNEPGRVLVEVQDAGIGFEPGAEERIFTAFEQASKAVTRTFGGLGLGLAISKATVEAHGGTIRAVSPGVGQGATFIVDLPLEGGKC